MFSANTTHKITLAMPVPVPYVSYLLIGGGAAGGGSVGGLGAGTSGGVGGGGGAGGFLTSTYSPVVSDSAYTVTVGLGGTGVLAGNGTNGESSSFNAVTAYGGGGGAVGIPIGAGYTNPYNNGKAGASGGGSTGLSGTPGTGISGQGYRGGYAYNSNTGAGTGRSGGGGGGAQSVGGDALGISPYYAMGGSGKSSNIVGINTIYSAGGNGGPEVTGVTPAAGAANTGNGGGGSINGTSTTKRTGAAGGSGVVVISYPETYREATTTGSVDYSVVSGTRIYKFTASGTITF